MGLLRPKVVLEEARELEAKGNNKEASRKYASLIPPLIKREKISEALILIDKAIVLSPESTRLLLTRALCLIKLNRNPEAENEIEKFALAALRQNRLSQYMELIEDKAREQVNLQKKFYEKILSIERTRPEVVAALAKVFKRMGKSSNAVEILAEDSIHSKSRSVFSPLNEENVHTLKSLIQELEEQLGERPPGIETLSGLVTEFKEKVLQVVRGDSKSVLDLAIAFKEMGLAAEAKEMISSIEPIHSRYLAAQCLLGEIEFEHEAYFSSLDIFQKILRSESNDEECKKDALYHVVRIYIHFQDFIKAAEFADKLSEMDSSYRNLSHLRNEISAKLESHGKAKLR
jgi:tetratricopeptide (TPR) repeat protein